MMDITRLTELLAIQPREPSDLLYNSQEMVRNNPDNLLRVCQLYIDEVRQYKSDLNTWNDTFWKFLSDSLKEGETVYTSSNRRVVKKGGCLIIQISGGEDWTDTGWNRLYL
jgi:hypothetical protein